MTDTTAPAIRFLDYMGDYDDLNMVNLIGPYPTADARDRDLARLAALPLGRPEFNGGCRFVPATMAEAVPSLLDGETVPPEQVAAATTLAGFYTAYYRLREEDDGPAEIPGQIAIEVTR